MWRLELTLFGWAAICFAPFTSSICRKFLHICSCQKHVARTWSLWSIAGGCSATQNHRFTNDMTEDWRLVDLRMVAIEKWLVIMSFEMGSSWTDNYKGGKLVNWSLTRTEVLRSKRSLKHLSVLIKHLYHFRSSSTCFLEHTTNVCSPTHHRRHLAINKNTKKAWKIIRNPWPLGLEGAWSSLGVDLFEESLVQQSRSLKEMTKSQVKWSIATCDDGIFVMNMPTWCQRGRVLLHHLGPPEKLLSQLIDSPSSWHG